MNKFTSPKYVWMLMSGANSRHGLWLLPLCMAIIISMWMTMRSSTFTSGQNISNLIAQAAPLILTSLGQLMVVLIGGLDLSVGAVISLSTSILVIDAPWFVVLPCVFIVAALIGLTNGVLIARFNVHPIIATLSMSSLIQGAALLLRPVAGGTPPAMVAEMVNAKFLGLPMPVLWVLASIVCAWLLIHRSRFGLHIYAVGGGISAARFHGIPVERIIVSAYMLSSIFAAAAGVFLAGRIGSGDPLIGSLFAIESITAVALGGAQLAGGIGSVWSAVTGAVFLALLANGMNLENLSAFIQTVIKGSILLAVVAMQPRKNIGL
jgi:ribose transport system permease protein